MAELLPPAIPHKPYDGSSKPFNIGVRPLDIWDWIEVDANLPAYLKEKAKHYLDDRHQVIVSEGSSVEAQSEVLAMLSEHMCERYPNIYCKTESGIDILNGQFQVALDDQSLPPLAIAAKLVQEDLVLMSASPEGWRLVAASLCFPSAWNLLEKFGHPLHKVHGPVPGFGTGTRNASVIDRMFDNLRPEQPVMRWNWSLHEDGQLHHPISHSGSESRFGSGDIGGHVFLRVERQTLRKLPKSGDIVFTVRIYLDPLEVLETMQDGDKLAAAIDEQLSVFSVEQESYKGLVGERERLSERLRQIAASHGG
jgi:dimethylamine monooxygenase subunit A